MTSKKPKKPGTKGVGIGPHQEVSPMARGTVTKNKKDCQERQDRKKKQQGWKEE